MLHHTQAALVSVMGVAICLLVAGLLDRENVTEKGKNPFTKLLLLHAHRSHGTPPFCCC